MRPHREAVTPEEREAEEYFTARSYSAAEHGHGWLWMLVLGFFAVMTAWCSGCAGAAKPLVTDHVTTVTVVEKCATTPRPAPVPVPPPRLCGAEVCYSKVDYAHLLADVEALLAWADQTAALCAPAPGGHQ